MTKRRTPRSRERPMVYEIRLKGRLGHQWAAWFGDATLELEEDGDTLLTCAVVDQAALYGLLRKVRDLNLPLVSVTRRETHHSHSKEES